MRRRHRLTAVIFGLCALAVVEGLGWATWQLLRLESRQAQARGEQEAVRLALWRLDSALAPILAAEAARPYFHYRAFYPAERAYTRMWAEVLPGEVLVPSPVLADPGPYVRLHFQLDERGDLVSPQVPAGNMRDQAEAAYVAPGRIIEREEELAYLRGVLARRGEASPHAQERLGAGGRDADGAERAREADAVGKARSEHEFLARERSAQAALRYGEAPAQTIEPAPEEKEIGDEDFDARRERLARSIQAGRALAVEEDAGAARRPAPSGGPVRTDAGPPSVAVSAMSPAWIEGPQGAELVLLRLVKTDEGTYVQGAWMDWDRLSGDLSRRIADLLPTCRIVPMPGLEPGARPRGAELLASIPARLEPGTIPATPLPVLTPLRATLGVTWLAVLAAVAAAGIVLRASIRLGERRGRFVAAVTHELRTPLTTFELYTDMLAEGRVREEGSRREYLETLRRESRRLARIVEDVLDYARLGERARADEPDTIGAAELVEAVLPALKRQAEASGLTLGTDIHVPDGARVRAAVPGVERILLNLVDNAGKYARTGEEPGAVVRARVEGGRLEVGVEDGGPGVPAGDRRRIFEPFERGAEAAAGGRSGIGLGLALARGIAREMGGDLELRSPAEGGSAFVLMLPLAAGGVTGRRGRA